MPDLIDDLTSKIKAGFQAFTLTTQEPRRAINALCEYGRRTQTPVVAWSSIHGMRLLFPLVAADETTPELARATRLIESTLKSATNGELVGNLHGALDLITNERAVTGAAGHDPILPSKVLFVVHDAHTFFGEQPPLRTRLVDLHRRTMFVRPLEDPRTGWSVDFDHPVVFLQSAPRLHDQVDFLLERLTLPLMTPDEVASECVDYIKAGLPEGATGLEGEAGAALRLELAGLCTGLLKHQIDDILSLAARDEETKTLGFTRKSLRAVRSYRAGLINESGLLTVGTASWTFGDVGGLGALKDYLRRILRPRTGPARVTPKGILLVGVSGSGKSMIAQALGNETDRTTIRLDVGDLLGGVVGQSEQQVKRALEIVDAAGKSVLLIDEVEKALAGTKSSGQTDSGVMSRVFGKLLTWLNDHESDCYVICTANDVTQIPPEFARAERFDALYFLDVPSGPARRSMWDTYIAKYGLDPRQPLPTDQGWTGAEIASTCRQAALLESTLAEAARSVVPVTRRAPEVIEELRAWARRTGCVDAEHGTPYGAQAATAAEEPAHAASGRRRIAPTAN